ncbi:tripartite motif-containing protein 56 [Mytilus galloprovincialis]|uniref:Tripartite motif-containing protein 56 n=1 Tax=Mytilus galloprovincialis TaxID=29158 RepID=A0A8B6DBI8_MYTGA|nr:tripartite motif-containing protein 56 [Mytilus galloprovincialis]
MATSYDTCDNCSNEPASPMAVTWCPECEEKLCDECSHRHRFSKVTKDHDAIPLVNYKQLSMICETSVFCKDHNHKVKIYCRNHELPLCKSCVLTTHRNCENTAILAEAAKNVKTSTTMCSLLKDLKDIISNLAKAANDRETNLSSIDEDEERIKQSISTTRDQYKVSNTLAMVSDKSRNELKELLTELREREDKMLQLENNLTYINKYASDINVLVIMHEIAKIVHEEEEYLKRIYNAGTLDRIKISVKGSSCVEAFEDLDITVKKATPMINIEKNIQGQMVMVRASGYDNVKFQIKKRFSDIRRKEHIIGCCVLPGGKIVFADNSGELTVLKMNGKGFTFSLNGASIFDVCAIGINTVGITTGMDSSIYIIDLKKLTAIKSKDTPNFCCGIAYHDDKIIVCVKLDGIVTVNLKMTNLKLIFLENLPWGSYVTTFEDNICFTNNRDRNVSVINSVGQIIWKLKFEQYKPFGIAADNMGNIYVAGHIFLMVIPSDGKRKKRLDGDDDGLFQPWAVAYDEENKSIIVANLAEGPVFVYSQI